MSTEPSIKILSFLDKITAPAKSIKKLLLLNLTSSISFAETTVPIKVVPPSKPVMSDVSAELLFKFKGIRSTPPDMLVASKYISTFASAELLANIIFWICSL
ncbi:hypothetical protein LCGC14_2171950 [marine sediment metagenome]|uniref:Uncharacterized protein n=1 Tax=marine sediment metagenome TaxID=412755 RepID=A0A0F9GKU3_9ZZZZ